LGVEERYPAAMGEHRFRFPVGHGLNRRWSRSAVGKSIMVAAANAVETWKTCVNHGLEKSGTTTSIPFLHRTNQPPPVDHRKRFASPSAIPGTTQGERVRWNVGPGQ